MEIGKIYNDKLDTLDSGISRFSSLLSNNTEKLRRTIINSILVFIILFVFGCFDFVTWKFDFVRITTVEYWTTIITKLVAAICSFNVGINFNWESTIQRALELKQAIELYDILIKQKDDGNFEYYVNHIYNKESKKKAYKNKINKKIYRLNRFSLDKSRTLYSEEIPKGVPNYESEKEALEIKKSNNRYCIKRTRLETLKSDDYVDKNIDSIWVWYSKVNPATFDLDISAKTKNEDNRTTGNVGLGRAKASSSVALSIFAVSLFTTSLVISINQQQFIDQMQAFWFYLLTCLIDAGIVIWNLFRGSRACKPLVEEQLTVPYTNRNKILTRYIEWKIKNNIKPSDSQQYINKLVDEENNVVEMSEEEFNKLKS